MLRSIVSEDLLLVIVTSDYYLDDFIVVFTAATLVTRVAVYLVGYDARRR